MGMEWYVYIFNINKQKIEPYNIFNHYSFREYTKKAAKKFKTKEEFAEQVKRELQYYFWSKAEYELIVEITEDGCVFLSPWCGCKEPEKARVYVSNDEGYDWIGFTNMHTKRQIYGNKAKIDIYDQVMFDWDNFVEYVYSNEKQKGRNYDKS